MNCFRIVFRFEAGLPLEDRNGLLNDFLRVAIEAHGLQFGGGGGDNVWEGYAESGSEGEDKITQEQRDGTVRWLAGEGRVLDYLVGDLFEAEPISEEFLGKLEAVVAAMEAGHEQAEVDWLLEELNGEE